jgi:hypothetical protein
MTTSNDDVVTRLVAHVTTISDQGLDADDAIQQLREIASDDTLLDDAIAVAWAGDGALEERRRRVELLARARYEKR